jgi:hypothetical protein
MKHMFQKLGAVSTLIAACAIAQAGEAATVMGAPAAVMAAAQVSASSAMCPGDPALSSLQRRLLGRYDQGVPALARYVWLTRAIHQLDATETATWAMTYRSTHPAC